MPDMIRECTLEWVKLKCLANVANSLIKLSQNVMEIELYSGLYKIKT